MNVLRIKNRIFSSNSYLSLTSRSGECILVDPGLDLESIEQELESRELKIVAVFCTHGHFDHVGTADHFTKKYGVPLYLPRGDLKLSQSSNFLLMACKINARISIPTPDFLIEDGFSILIGEDLLRFIGVPGHTLGSGFIEFRGALFTGDSLYKNAVGLVNFPGEKPDVLRSSLLKVWDQLAEELVVYPGHGDSGSFGEIKQKNVRLRRFLNIEPEDETTPFPENAAKTSTGSSLSPRQLFEEELE